MIAYAAPGAAIKGMTLPLISYLPPVYAALSGFSLTSVGLVFMFVRLWDLIIDPVAGSIMDGTSPPLGNRKFWIALSTPVLMLLLLLLFNPTSSTTLPQLAGMLIVFYIAWTLLTISYAAWPTDLAKDQENRTRMIAWREWAGVLGMLGVLASPVLIAGPGASLPKQLSIMGSTLIVLLPLAVLPALIMLPRAIPEQTVQTHRSSILDGWRLIRHSRKTRTLLLANLLSGCGYAANSATSFFVFSNYLKLEPQYSMIMLCFMVGMIVGVPVLMKLSLWFGAQRGFMVAMIGSAAASLAFVVIPPNALYLTIIVNATLGFFTGGYQLNLNAEMVRLAGEDRDQSGSDRTSQHLALLEMTNKLGYALAIGFVYALLAIFSGDTAVLSDLPNPALLALGTVLPAALFVGSALAFHSTKA
jgi:GPH family glycoside/pentoside/hexuronide:cation symporter